MTDNEINIAIALTQGWDDIVFRGIFGEDDYVGRHESCRPKGSTGQWQGPIPKYATDLNAIHEAEKILNPDQEERYVTRLGSLLMSAAYEDDPRWINSNLASSDSTYRATARQRCEALLRTLGKWKE